ncbi:guanine nucleotide-binding protein subunit alpha [Coemansia sp. RSA 788]|nr:guanine nucleotide-binding protein subunit alpha [Coemansia sp. RSA 788]
MGCGASKDDLDEKRANDEIENQLRKDRMNMRNEVKMLLLGAGESGKSTIIKQMKLIHDGGYSQEERESFKEVIFSNTIQSMRVLLEAMDTLHIALENAEYQVHADVVMGMPNQIEADNLPTAVATAVRTLWEDDGVQECFKRSNEFQLNDSASYYFDSIGRICQEGYLPSDQDVLRSRVKTTGINETVFRYDQVLIEDESVNRMQEALTLFDSICNSRWFVKTSIILFLNKMDIFHEKLPHSPMRKYFPDYDGGNDPDAASEYILKRFVSLNQSEAKHIYTHYTCATDTSQIKFVMAAVNDIIIQTNLRDCGLL